MKIPYFQIDAFTTRPFGGNPAGVCLLDAPLSAPLMQQIASENNQAETAFIVLREEDGLLDLRWFTPAFEIDLCGHATLAAAYLLFQDRGFKGDFLRFRTQSGVLGASRRGGLVELDFPSRPAKPCSLPDAIVRGLGRQPRAIFKARDFMAVFDSEAEVAAIRPDAAALCELESPFIIATAEGTDCDFVSRFFAPRAGIPEDHVTGSSHCTLIPYWAQRLGKTEMFARQISKRGGELYVRDLGERVRIGGACHIYSRGELDLPDGY